MEVLFTAFGHRNITASHSTTIEFTKDANLTKTGHCIAGVKCDFTFNQLKKLLDYKKARLSIIIDSRRWSTTFDINPDFSHKEEIVIRITEFLSDRTLGIKADKASSDIPRALVASMRKSELFNVIITTLE